MFEEHKQMNKEKEVSYISNLLPYVNDHPASQSLQRLSILAINKIIHEVGYDAAIEAVYLKALEKKAHRWNARDEAIAYALEYSSSKEVDQKIAHIPKVLFKRFPKLYHYGLSKSDRKFGDDLAKMNPFYPKYKLDQDPS